MMLIHKRVTQGDEMSKPPGLRLRGGSWEFRKRIPDRVRTQLGKTEHVKSFGGVPRDEAYRKGWLEHAKLAQLIQLAEAEQSSADGPALTEAELADLAKQFLRELEATAPIVPFTEERQRELKQAFDEEAFHVGQPGALEDATLQGVADAFAERAGVKGSYSKSRFAFYEAIQSSWLEYLQRQSRLLSGGLAAPINPVFADVRADAPLASNLTLEEAISAFETAPSRSNNAPKTQVAYGFRLRMLSEIMGPKRQVAALTRADARAYLAQLISVPANAAQRYKGRTALQAIEIGRAQGVATLSAKSIQLYLDAANTLFRWLLREEMVERNPFLQMNGPAVRKIEVRTFTTDELNKLMRASSLEAVGEEKWLYWICRINLLQGFRFAEPLWLTVGDLVEINGSWFFRFRANDGHRFKNSAANRDVPVHPLLIKLGLLRLKKNRLDTEPLIPGVPRGKDQNFSLAEKRPMKLIRKHVSRDRELVFHSLRHTFRDACREAQVPQDVVARLGGWKFRGNDAMEGYGEGLSRETLKGWIAKIDYPGVEID